MTLIPPKTRIMLKFLLPQRRRPDPRHAIPEADRDLTGKTIVFTGGTAGMGRLAVEILREMGADLVLLGRNAIKGEAVATELRAIEGAGTVEFELCDLASMASVQACAARILATRSRIDVLINCAGAHLSERRVTTDGFEANWAVNYLGPYLLTRLLLDRIQESAQARIVNLTTNTDWLKHFDDVQSANDFDATDAYTQGKLALSMFTRTLGEQLEDGDEVLAYLLSPEQARGRTRIPSGDWTDADRHKEDWR